MTENSHSPSLRRRMLFSLAGVLLVGVIIEAFSYVLLSMVEGSPAPLDEYQKRRVVLTDEPAELGGLPERRLRDVPYRFLRDRKKALHPYVGYVLDRTEGSPIGGARSGRAASLGFLGNLRSLIGRPVPERVVVAVLGGSVAGQICVMGGRLKKQLAQNPRFSGRDVRVVCLAAGGYKEPQQLLIVSYLLSLGVHLDVLINIDGFNEVTLPIKDNVAQGTFPFYPRNWRFLVEVIDPEDRRLRGEITVLRALRSRMASAFASRPWRLSPTANLIWYVGDRRVQHLIGARERDLVQRVGDRTGSYQTTGPRWQWKDDAALMRDLVDVWRMSSLQLHRLAASNGIEYHHFLQPNQYVDGSKQLNAEERRTAWDATSPFHTLVPRGYRLLIEAGARLQADGVTFHDLTQLFVDEPETVYADRCCHFNQRGVDALVDTIDRSLSRAQTSDPIPP